ncbi:MAG TPA: 16S rRNA (cytidine(1402)-2'-O)-methyltransferase [Pyrinomonadaceae bacterium]|jgi:16S rRNA (cytidine1402-2'-O)-methyltransferase
MAGTLYLVATPIGNLEDITQRALRVLAEVDVIACEDTRRTGLLLSHYGIKTKMLSYHEHNEQARARSLYEMLLEGASIAVVSDAGTPGINDPGYRLVNLATTARNIRVVPVPGATALIAALIASGLPTDQFFFGGFLPARTQARRTRLEDVRAFPSTLIFYEAPHRLGAALADAREILGEREAVVARELTKLHEEVVRGRLSELAERFAAEDAARGEIVLVIDRDVIEGCDTLKSSTTDVATRVAALENEGLDPRAALKRAARELGLSRPEAYRRLTAARRVQ